MSDADLSSIPALDRGLSILEMIHSSPNGCSFSTIIDNMDAPKSSLVRLLAGLTRRGYLCKESDSGHYVPGPALLNLSEHMPEYRLLQRESADILASLSHVTGTTAICFHWDDNGQCWQCAAKCVHEHAPAMQHVGEVRTNILDYPWGVFAWMQMDEATRTAILSTHNDPQGMRSFLDGGEDELAQSGCTMDVGRYFIRITAPLYRTDGSLAGAVAMGGLPDALPRSFYAQAKKELLAHTKRLSHLMGWDSKKR